MNRLLTVLTWLLVGLAAQAQTHYDAHVSLGAHGGVALSRMSFSPEVRQTWLMGPAIGVDFAYAEEKLFGLAAELNFEQRGWKEAFDDPALQYSRTLDYLSLPVMTRISFGGSRVKCRIDLGPQVGVIVADNISSNFDYRNPGILLPATRRVNQMSMKIHNRFDYGICAGIGGEFAVRPRHMVNLGVRFYYGLGNIFPSSKADEFSASRSMSLTATAGYSFRLR